MQGVFDGLGDGTVTIDERENRRRAMQTGAAAAGETVADASVTEEKAAKTPRERWLTLGKNRGRGVLEALRVLGHCANPASYEYTPEEVKAMFSKLQDGLDRTQQLFEGGVQKDEDIGF